MTLHEMLPIGSVILLEEAQKRLMIYGVKQTNEDGIEYDYIGVPYPEGCLGAEAHFLFNHEDIDRIFFIGMNDGERQLFIQNLENYYNNPEAFNTSTDENESDDATDEVVAKEADSDSFN